MFANIAVSKILERFENPGVLLSYEYTVVWCVFKAPRTYTPVLGALVSPLGTRGSTSVGAFYSTISLRPLSYVRQ